MTILYDIYECVLCNQIQRVSIIIIVFAYANLMRSYFLFSFFACEMTSFNI